ncbi:hypothetical protein QE152_g22276 [Popillia japonica]|uniref:Peptidase A2 domain-containing protein n=1 Tax=Popillia japonica TaxID=7064 RepID=A0AAW1KM48_POPJA
MRAGTSSSEDGSKRTTAGRRMRAGTSSSEDGSKRTTFRAKKHQPSERCECCGRSNHIRQNCYFKSALCHICGKRGHISPVYTSKNNKGKNRFKNFKGNSHYIDSNIDKINENVNNDDSDSNLFHIHSLNGNFPPFKVKIKIDNVLLTMEIDTGSATSIISEYTYTKTFVDHRLVRDDIDLKSYNGAIINCIGYFNVNVSYQDTLCNMLKLYVVRDGDPPLMGRDWLRKLNISVNPAISANNISTEDRKAIINRLQKEYSDVFSDGIGINRLQKEYSDVFSDGIGTFKNYEAKLYLKPGATPVFSKARAVPFSIKNKIEQELDNLIERNIIFPVDFSDWATPIVPVI